MTSSNWKILRVTGPLCGEFIGHWWIPHTRASDAELCCFLFICALNNRLSKQSWGWWFETTPHPLWRQFNGIDQLQTADHMKWPNGTTSLRKQYLSQYIPQAQSDVTVIDPSWSQPIKSWLRRSGPLKVGDQIAFGSQTRVGESIWRTGPHFTNSYRWHFVEIIFVVPMRTQGHKFVYGTVVMAWAELWGDVIAFWIKSVYVHKKSDYGFFGYGN